MKKMFAMLAVVVVFFITLTACNKETTNADLSATVSVSKTEPSSVVAETGGNATETNGNATETSGNATKSDAKPADNISDTKEVAEVVDKQMPCYDFYIEQGDTILERSGLSSTTLANNAIYFNDVKKDWREMVHPGDHIVIRIGEKPAPVHQKEKKEQTSTPKEKKEQTSTSKEKKEKTSTSEKKKEQTSTSKEKKEKTSTSEKKKEQTPTPKEEKDTTPSPNEQSEVELHNGRRIKYQNHMIQILDSELNVEANIICWSDWDWKYKISPDGGIVLTVPEDSIVESNQLFPEQLRVLTPEREITNMQTAKYKSNIFFIRGNSLYRGSNPEWTEENSGETEMLNGAFQLDNTEEPGYFKVWTGEDYAIIDETDPFWKFFSIEEADSSPEKLAEVFSLEMIGAEDKVSLQSIPDDMSREQDISVFFEMNDYPRWGIVGETLYIVVPNGTKYYGDLRYLVVLDLEGNYVYSSGEISKDGDGFYVGVPY